MAEHLPVLPLACAMDGGWGVGWGIGMMGAMILFWVVLTVGVIWLVLYLVRRPDRIGQHGRRPGHALQILERRFAAGEMNAEEYRQRRSALQGEH